jgi:hypothetical protein
MEKDRGARAEQYLSEIKHHQKEVTKWFRASTPFIAGTLIQAGRVVSECMSGDVNKWEYAGLALVLATAVILYDISEHHLWKMKTGIDGYNHVTGDTVSPVKYRFAEKFVAKFNLANLHLTVPDSKQG